MSGRLISLTSSIETNDGCATAPASKNPEEDKFWITYFAP